MRVLQGNLTETIFLNTDIDDHNNKEIDKCSENSTVAPLIADRVSELKPFTTAYIHDQIGWHCVGNQSLTEPALSIHLYAPPIFKCQTYCGTGNKKRALSACPYYSMYGNLC